jgi:Flp pilus assembly protein TadD
MPDDPGAKAAAKDPAADAGGASSSSSSGAGLPGAADDEDKDAKPGLKDEGTAGSTRSARRRLRPPAQKTLSDDERVDEDLEVAKFYTSRGNLMGAYLRAKDAVKVEPNEPDGHLALAGVAEKMGKKDEAMEEYTTYLKLDPDGDGVKAAKRALAALKP